MKWSLKRQLVVLGISGLPVLGLVGCAYPGMQESLVAQGNDARYTDGRRGDPNVDLFPIDIDTIARLKDESDANTVAAGRLPADFEDPYQYRIGPEDLIRVTVWDHPELNNPGALTGGSSLGLGTTASTSILGTSSPDAASRVVNNDGTMYFPYVGSIQVAGKTTTDVQAFLTAHLARVIREPQVEVVVASFRSKRAYVTGSVKSPGSVPITDVPLRVTDLLAAAGGADSSADITAATLGRGGAAIKIDIYKMLYEGDLHDNLLVKPGDVLNLPVQRVNKIFVLGEVAKPASLPLPGGAYTLNEALADAGGVSQITANSAQIYVIRAVTGHTVVFHLNASAPDALVLADTFTLKPRDIIFVDAAAVVRLGRVLSQVLPSAEIVNSLRN